VCLLIAGLAWRFAPATRPVTGNALVRSLADKLDSPDPNERCEKRAPKVWACAVPDTSGSGAPTHYSVRMRGDHCWRARRVRSGLEGRTYPRHPEGCVRFRHQGALFEQIF
jgi:hypothetical protein